MNSTLLAPDRIELRARAHHLHPSVIIGDAGLTDAVLTEIGRALRAHELIKIRVSGDDRAKRSAIMTQVCEQLGAQPVQMIGKLLVVYRAKPVEAVAQADQPHPDRRAGRGGAGQNPKRASARSGAAVGRSIARAAHRAIGLPDQAAAPKPRPSIGQRAAPQRQATGSPRRPVTKTGAASTPQRRGATPAPEQPARPGRSPKKTPRGSGRR